MPSSTIIKKSVVPLFAVIFFAIITINIKRPYAEYIQPVRKILPKKGEEWVFSHIDHFIHTATEYAGKVRDHHGHTFEFHVEFGNNCFTVRHARLDGVDVRLSTQTYTTGQLNTCGWTSEPNWTIPLP